jgi:hypothetical protein
VETMTFWAEYHGGFKGFSPNEFFEWEDSHPLCSNALSPSGSVMITIKISITIISGTNFTYGLTSKQNMAMAHIYMGAVQGPSP